MKARNPFGAVRVSNHIILFIARHHKHSHCRTREKKFYVSRSAAYVQKKRRTLIFMVHRGSKAEQKALLDGMN